MVQMKMWQINALVAFVRCDWCSLHDSNFANFACQQFWVLEKCVSVI